MCYLWKLERFTEMLIGVVFVALGLSFMMKSGLGQTALTAFIQCVSLISGVKSGTLIMLFYLLCVFLQLLIQKKEFDKRQVLQILISWIQGTIVNLFCYDVAFFANIKPASYLMQWIFMIAGIVLVSSGVAVTMAADLVKQPFEQLIMVLANKYYRSFRFMRCGADAFFILISLLMIFGFSLDFTSLREGTWISMLLMGNSMAVSIPLIQRYSLSYRRMHDVTVRL